MGGRTVWYIIVVLFHATTADVYLHIPRGSNNRLNEKSANRANANRMFDSQNNNRGGYNVGDLDADAAVRNVAKQYQMKYFMSGDSGGKTYLDVEWTNQHGCGGSEDKDPHKQNCNLVLQYMCQEENIPQRNILDKIRPGVETNTQDYTGSARNSASLQQKTDNKINQVKSSRGLNEPWEWYDKCYTRERNKGLFTADQILKNNNGQGVSAASYTRQNPNGNRYAYECPEERDYFPYWHPTPWIDIAVLTDNTTMCPYYEEHSFNRASYGECVEFYSIGNRRKHSSQFNNPSSCTQAGHQWTQFYNYIEKDTASSKAACEAKTNAQLTYKWAIPFDTYDKLAKVEEECLVLPPPIRCEQAPWSRSNHLGNGRGGAANTYKWEIPYFPSGEKKTCVLRMRYNISTDDYGPWTTDASHNKNPQAGTVSPVQQNPYVNIGADISALRLAINTAQFGRTFQDRSHPFVLKPRPLNARTQNIYNVNVRGKRGNIVQVYPAVEYDFAPNTLEINEGDLVHFQWTGSNTHNNNNPGGDGQTGDAGEGTRGTDRSNVVELKDLSENFPVPYENSTLWANIEVVSLPYDLPKAASLSGEDLAVNMMSAGYFRCMKRQTCTDYSVEQKAALNKLLNNAPASYEAPLIKIKVGTYHYTCTRNNNFTNRSQKATLIVK